MIRIILLLTTLLLSTASSITQDKQNIILEEDFSAYQNGSDGSPTWNPIKGNWRVINGEYRQQTEEYDCASLIKRYVTAGFEFESSFEYTGNEVGVGIIFSSRDLDNIKFSQMIRFDGNKTLLIGYFYNGEFTATASAQTPPVEKNKLYKLTLRIEPSRYKCSVLLDDQPVLLDTPIRFSSGYTGLENSAGNAIFRKVVVREIKSIIPIATFPWIEHFTRTSDNTFIIPMEQIGTLYLIDQSGEIISTIGNSTQREGQLHRPHACASLDESTLVITDRGKNSILKFSLPGICMGSTGWKGKNQGEFDDPEAIATNARRQIFIVDRNNNRIQVFDENLKFIDMFGADRLSSPTDISVNDSIICVLNTGLSQIEIFHWQGKKASWQKSISYGGGEGRGIAVFGNKIFVSIFNEVRSYDLSGRRLKSFYGRSVNFVLPQCLHADSSGLLYISDYNYGRIITTNTDLLDPEPAVSYNGLSGVNIGWESIMNEKSVLTYKDTDGNSGYKINLDASNYHSVTLSYSQMQKGKYSYTFSPTLPVIPALSVDQPRYTFNLPDRIGHKYYSRIPIACIIFANITDDTASTGVTLPPLPDTEIKRIKNQISDGVRFYWIHSGMRLFLDLETIIVHEQLRRKDVYGPEWWYPPRDSVLEHYLHLNERNISDYTGILFITCARNADTTSGEYVLAGKGGGFTMGVGTGKGYGISWWDATRENHNAGNNWLMVHEFNHQLDDIFLASGYPEYWFNHISPTIGTAAKFGEHFDANAFILRMVPPEEWYDLAYTTLSYSRDMDKDEIPDDDPKLPLDEVRLGSDSTKTDSDGDGVDDLDELRFSNWIVEGWGETYSSPSFYPRLDIKDSDSDGLNDGEDPLPCFPYKNEILSGNTEIVHHFADLADEKIHASVYASWNEDSLFFIINTDRLTPMKFMIDGNNDGWFTGRENILIRLSPESDSILNREVQVFNATDPSKWPFMDKNMEGITFVSSAIRKTTTGYRIFLSIGRSEKLNLRYERGSLIGLNIGFLRPFAENMNRYVNMFEPNRFIEIVLR